MTFSDILRMALHNLWRRRLRTSLNLIGVVIGSVVLLMTSAGTRGARDAIRALFDASEFARQIQIQPDRFLNITPPDSALVVLGEMSEARRTRIREAMTNHWKSEYQRSRMEEAPEQLITQEKMQSLSQLSHVTAVIPEWYMSCRLRRTGDVVNSRIVAADVTSDMLRQRLLAGEMLAGGDMEGMLIDEFLAYQLGYRSDSELMDVVGQRLSIEVTSRDTAISVFSVLTNLQREISQSDLGQIAEFTAAGRQLLTELDSTSLSEPHKKLLRETLSNGFKAADQPISLVIRRQLTVRGVVRQGYASSPMGMLYDQLNLAAPGVVVNPETVLGIANEMPDFRGCYNAVVMVDSTASLQAVTDELKRSGYHGSSAMWLLENIDSQIDQSKWVLYGIAAAILLTAAIGISNTLVISVLERTPEFGILKAIGAKDRHLILLMLSEGAVLGLLGAVIAITVSLALSVLIGGIVRYYVESRLGSELASSIFRFSPWAMLFVITCSALICTLASILPAWRASRLDPVVAMRRT